MKALYDITPFTLLDFPDTPAAIFWFAGCNLRCSYCYNPDIVFGTASIDEAQALAFLRRRQGLLEGVVLSGGECTMYPNLLSFCHTIKELGFEIKIDTNAMRPDVLGILLDNYLIDYVALDYKAPEAKMIEMCEAGSEKRFWESFERVKKSKVRFEVRTTYHSDLLSIEDIVSMEKQLRERGYENEYFLQLFQGTVPTIGNLDAPANEVDLERLKAIATLRT
jgi:pyruvate formate lyase activating enzyme